MDLAPLEINIASRLRRSIKEAFNQDAAAVDMREVMLLLDSAAVEIVKLMTEAAIRYSLQQSDQRMSAIMTDLDIPDGIVPVHSLSLDREPPSPNSTPH